MLKEIDYRTYCYPENTPGSSNTGKYFHQLSEASQTALTAVERWVYQDNINLNNLGTNDLHHQLLILRYLRANQFNVSKTISHIEKNIEWRKSIDIDTLIKQKPEKILGCTLEDLTSVFPHWHSGYDKTGRPVLFKQYGKFEAGQIKKLVGGKNFDAVVQYHIWEQEACGRLCLAQAKKNCTIVETITAVIDIKDMGMSQITSDFLKLTKLIAEIDQHQYPETLGRAFIINAPSAFPLVWRMVKPWLDPATVAKITVLSGPKEFIPVLQDYIGEENLPSNYGGTLPPLSPQVHPYAETMLSYPTEEQTAEIAEQAVKTEEEAFDPLVLEYPYPESTPGAAPGNGKYWRQLNETSRGALLKVEQWVVQDKVDLKQLGTTDLHPALLLLRYLRANQFNATKTIAHIQKNLEWRRTRDIGSLVTQSPESILGCTMAELTSVFPHWHSGYDKTGRPVLFKQYGKFEAGLIKRLTGGNFDNVTRYHLWEQEACGRLCLEQSKKTQTVVETITAVIDIKDMGMSQITSDFLKLTKLIAEIDQHQYPETLGRAFIINAPSAFPLVWRMVKPWLDPATVAKITVLSGPKEFIPVLQDYIGEENLPSNYGGTLPPLSPQVHPYAETMLSLPVPAAPIDIPAEVEPQFDPEVLTYPYPESTPGAIPNNGKYWQNLSQTGQDALKSVEEWVVQDKVDLKQLGTTDLHPALLLLRYLRANQFNATKTIAHIQKNLEWRRTRDIGSLVTQSPESILGCTMAELTSVFPHWHSGYDKTGRPVLFKQYGKFEAGLIKKLVGGSFDNVVRYHLWEQEACGRLCLAQSQKRKMVIETITAVIDIKDMGMSQITRDFLSLTKLLAEIDQHQYPETLGRAFIINAPSAFPLVWRMVKPWLDPATVAKITVLSGPKEFIPVLQDYIGEENLPSNYGGTLPPLSPQVHPYAETMISIGTVESRSDEDARAAYMRVNDRNSFRNSFKRRGSFRGNNPTEAPAEQASSLWFYPSLMWTGLQKNWFMDSSPQDDNESEWDGGSEGSDSSDELHFEDAFETQSDLETNSHSHLYSNKPHEGTSSGPAKKKRKRSWLKRIFFMRTLMKCYRYIVCEKSLRALSIQRLEMRFLISSACHLLCAIGCAAISGTALAEISWSSSGARLQLWAFTVVMLLSCFMIFFDFVGYYGIQSKNWPLMVMYSAGTTVGTLVFAAVTIACFFYYALPRSTGVGGASLNSTLSKNRTFMFVLAVGSLFVTICATIPLVLARGVIVKLREAQGKHLQTRQIQVVLKVAQSISTIAALVMICYGSVGLEYLLSIYYSKALFPIYGLIYGGVAVLITSTIGVWVAMTVHRSVLRVYQYFILPFIVALLLIIALLCFDGLYNTEQGVENSYDNLNTSESEEKVKSTVQTLMLVTGTLTIFLCVFQTISLIATRALSSTIDSSSQVKEKVAILQAIKEKELGIYNAGGLVDGREIPNHDSYWSGFSVEHLGRLYMLYSRNQRDKFVITWAVLMGIFNIFVSGTLAVLSRSASTQEEQNSWMFSLNILLGRADTRFVISNAYLRSSETLLSVVIGPLMLLYAWSTFVYAPYRHVLGMMVSLSQMLIWTMYLLIELYGGMKHFQGRQAPTLLAFVIVIGFVCYFLLPGWIFVKDMISSVNDTSTSDSQELLMEANDETAPFLNKIEFDLESGTFFDGSNHAGGAAGTRKQPRTSDSSLEQMLNLGTRVRHPSLGGSTTSPETLFADDASTSTTRSFIMSLGTENAESNAELERYRARSASAFRFHDSHLSTTPAHTPLYADKVTPTSAARQALTTEDSENYKEDEIVEEEKKSDEVLSPTKIGGVPFPISPPSRILSPTRLRPTGIELPPTIPEDSQLSLYSPVGAVNISTPPSLYPRLSAQDSMTSFLRKRAVAPLKPRVSAESASSRNMTITGGITQVANATAALDPNRVLPMLMKMGVSSVEAAGMMTYLMHLKQLGDGKKKKKNSLAMVV